MVALPSPQSGFRRALRRVVTGVRILAEAAATPLLPEDFIDLIDPLRSGADLRGRVIDVRPETPTAATITIRPGRGWRPHTPGQYTRIGVDVDGVRHWRAYSITSPVGGTTITVTVRAIADGKVSNHVLHHLRPGTVILLDQAKGDFVLPSQVPDKVLYVTAGSGITPVMGMLRNAPLPRDVVVVHSAPTPAESLFLDELGAMERRGLLRLVTRFTREEGVLPVAGLDDVVPDWRTRHTWACGPTSPRRRRGPLERRRPPRAPAHRAFRPRIHAVGAGGEVTFTGSGVTVAADAATTLLDAGEGAGVLMPSGCRMGICFNCAVPMTEGSVRDLRTGDLTTANPEDPVLIQTCVSAAAGPCHLTL